MYAKCEVSISYGSKVIAKVKVDNRQTNKQTDRQTNKQTGQKQYAPDHSIRGHKKWKIPQCENFHVYSIRNLISCVKCMYMLKTYMNSPHFMFRKWYPHIYLKNNTLANKTQFVNNDIEPNTYRRPRFAWLFHVVTGTLQHLVKERISQIVM